MCHVKTHQVRTLAEGKHWYSQGKDVSFTLHAGFPVACQIPILLHQVNKLLHVVLTMQGKYPENPSISPHHLHK